MAKKKYVIKQQRKFNGDVSTATVVYECDETEIAAILALMEGKLTVLEENITLSSPDTQSDIVTNALCIDNVVLVHSEAKSKYFGAYGKPILFKASTSVTALQALFETHKPYTGSFATEFPDFAKPNVGNIGNL